MTASTRSGRALKASHAIAQIITATTGGEPLLGVMLLPGVTIKLVCVVLSWAVNELMLLLGALVKLMAWLLHAGFWMLGIHLRGTVS